MSNVSLNGEYALQTYATRSIHLLHQKQILTIAQYSANPSSSSQHSP